MNNFNPRPSLNRRQFIALAAAAGLSPRLRQGAEKLLPLRPITRGPKFHWFGYYDKFQFDPTNRYVLGMEVDFEHRSPRPDDVIRVGMIDLKDGDRWTELGTTRAWNWQQGCMLQWVPGSRSEVIWNDRIKDGTTEQFVAHLLDVKTGKRRTLPAPIYALSLDGQWAVAPDFRRLNDCRPGYGYTGIADPNAANRAPQDAGIWRMNLKTGKRDLILTFAQIAALPYQEKSRPFHNDPERAKHWFNHLLYSTDGGRFLFLHRWRIFDGLERSQVARGGFSTRMFTANTDGSDLYLVDPYGGTSHFVWRDPQHIAAWAWNPLLGEKFYLFKDKTTEVTPIGPDVMTVNGHNTYLPLASNRWILNDTYPDKDRNQNPYLFDTKAGARTWLGHFKAPPEYVGEWRCDTHPRASRDGRSVVIDSTHGGNGRQMYLIDIAKMITTTQ